METALALLSLGLLVFVAHLLSILFSRTKIPDVVILVLIGFLAGPVAGLVRQDYFGRIGGVFAIVTLVFILFGAGLDLGLSTLSRSISRASRLTVLNYVATLLIVTPISVLVFKLTIIEGLILGSILGQTSSSIVIPMVGQLNLQKESRAALILESTLSDVFSIVIALALLRAYSGQELNLPALAGTVVASFVVAVVLGILAALFWSTALNRTRQLKNSVFLTPAFVFITYAAAELLGFSGPIAALTFGAILGNIGELQSIQNLPVLRQMRWLWYVKRAERLSDREREFINEIGFLLRTFFFVYIGLSIRLDNSTFILAGLGLTLALLLFRIPVTRLALDKSVSRFDASITAVIIPKGVAAAAVAAVVAQAGTPHGDTVENVTYMLVLFTTVVTAVLVFFLEKTAVRRLYALFFSKYATETRVVAGTDGDVIELPARDAHSGTSAGVEDEASGHKG